MLFPAHRCFGYRFYRVHRRPKFFPGLSKIDIDLKLARRLEALGLTEGTEITILNNDQKGSLTAKFRGTRFALGRRIADNIEVKEA